MIAGHYHLHLHPISKQKGHSIHAALAYRHGTREMSASAAAAYRHAQEHGQGMDAYDYRNKIGVQWFGINAPDHAPAWCHVPKTLWSKVDEVEHRKNARLAQEIIIALPHQVRLEEHITMLKEFTTTHCILPYGMIADIAIHAPPTHHGGDPRNVHAHILLTDRPITADGFAKTKDRRYSGKGLVDQLRTGWTNTHNRHMERLGLPYRIDHRTLEQQRQDALARGDEQEAIILDRMPQIHLGKAAHGSHPKRTVHEDRLRQNRQILAYNTARHERHQTETQHRHFVTAHAALRESVRIKYAQDTWQPEPASLKDLQAAYGRPASTSRLGRLKDLAFENDVLRRALALSRSHKHPWKANGHREDAPSVFAILQPMVKTTGPGHPVFTVTAKDIVFAFYGLGFIGRREMQTSLKNIAQEEQRLFADRLARKPQLRPPPRLPRPKRPTYARPQQAIKQQLEKRLGALQAAIALHHERETAFEQRHIERTWQREQRRQDREKHAHARQANRSRQWSLPPLPTTSNDAG